jgi:hypothetical protein
LLLCCFFASVKSSFPAALSQMRRKYLFVVLLAGTQSGPSVYRNSVTSVTRLRPTSDPIAFRFSSCRKGTKEPLEPVSIGCPTSRGFRDVGVSEPRDSGKRAGMLPQPQHLPNPRPSLS